jgi:hypothetical protein
MFLKLCFVFLCAISLASTACSVDTPPCSSKETQLLSAPKITRACSLNERFQQKTEQLKNSYREVLERGDETSLLTVATQKKTIKEYGWVYINDNAFDQMRNFIGNNKVLSVCSGKGFYEYLLKNAGVNIVATDCTSPDDPYIDVQNMDLTDAVKKYAGYNCLLMIAAPPRLVGSAITAFQGDKLIYVGELSSDSETGLDSEIWEEKGPPLEELPLEPDHCTLLMLPSASEARVYCFERKKEQKALD